MNDRDEVLNMLDAGDVHALMLRVGEMWRERYHPGARFVELLADNGEGVPLTRYVISSSPAGAPPVEFHLAGG